MTEPTSSDAKHAQIYRDLRTDIEAGKLRPDERLPSSRALADRWGVSIGTVNQAMDQLTRDGLIVSRPRSGRAVAPAPAEEPRRPRPRAVYVGGYAGSGKTEVGRVLARLGGYAMLDKDTITRAVVDAALVQLGSTIADRESPIYLDVVRPGEYQCLADAVTENIACGVSTVATAPFLREFPDRRWFERTSAALDALGADMSVIWIRTSAAAMRSYIERRAAARDTWKLSHWDDYLTGVDTGFTPPWPHTIIGNDPTDQPIQDQVRAFLRDLETP